MPYSTQAPRFHAMLQRTRQASVLTMAQSEWQSAVSVPDRYVELDISATPMADVKSDATVLASVAVRYSGGIGQVEIYRDDPRDAPYTVNGDFFTVIENIQDDPKFDEIVSDASTSMDSNLLDYIQNTVFLVPQPRDERHWSTGLPDHVMAVMGPRPQSSASSSL